MLSKKEKYCTIGGVDQGERTYICMKRKTAVPEEELKE
jgi:hypothetical protein